MLSPELFAALSQRSLMDQQFAAELGRLTNPILSNLASWLRNRLAREGERIDSQKRLDKLEQDVLKRSSASYQEIIDLYFNDMYELAEDEALFVSSAISAVLIAGIKAKKLEKRKAKQAVNNNPLVFGKNNQTEDFKKYIRSLGDFSNEVASAIVGGYHQGQSVPQITSAVIGTRAAQYQDGLIDLSRRSAERLVRTAVTHISTQIRDAVFKDNSDIIYGYRIVATLDSRTSAICRGYDGRVVRYTAKFQPKPPFHPNCRTGIIPEINGRSLEDTGATRAAGFKGGTVGQVSAQKKYYDVLKAQPADIQDSVLGKARGLIFRNSGLSADEFRKALTDTMGNPLTLSEMAERNNTILSYMRKNSFLDDYLPEGG